MQLNAGTSSTRLSLSNAPEAKEIPVWLSQLRQSSGGSGRKKKAERPEPETEIRSRLAREVEVLQRCTDWLQRQERGENVVVNSLQTRHGRWCCGFFGDLPESGRTGFPTLFSGKAINLCEDFVRIVLVGPLGIPAGEESPVLKRLRSRRPLVSYGTSPLGGPLRWRIHSLETALFLLCAPSREFLSFSFGIAIDPPV